MWEKENSVQRETADAATNIRVKAESKIAKREREATEARANDEAEIQENAEKTRKARETKAKSETETAEMERLWAKEKAKEKA